MVEKYRDRKEYREVRFPKGGHKLIRIDGDWYMARDIGVDDFEAAEASRWRQHITDTWWSRMEGDRDEAVKNNQPLPPSVPVAWEGIEEERTREND